MPDKRAAPEEIAYLAAWRELVVAADLAAADPQWHGAEAWTTSQVRALASAQSPRLLAIAGDRLAVAAAQVAAIRHIAAELMPALTALQRQAQQRALVAAAADAQRAAVLAAALDASAQIVRNSLSLLKELPLGPADDAAVDQLLWGLALHAQIRCVRAHSALPADGHALAALAGALQLLQATLQRHGYAAAAQRAGLQTALGGGALAAYAEPASIDGMALGLAVLRDGLLAVRWLREATAGGEDAV